MNTFKLMHKILFWETKHIGSFFRDQLQLVLFNKLLSSEIIRYYNIIFICIKRERFKVEYSVNYTIRIKI